MADAKRSAAAKQGWENHCKGTSRSQVKATKPKASKAQPKAKARIAKGQRPTPPALRHTGAPIDPYANADLRTLEYVYGRAHVGAALEQYSMDGLRDTAYSMGISKPGTTKRQVIASILRAHRQGKRSQAHVYRPSKP